MQLHEFQKLEKEEFRHIYIDACLDSLYPRTLLYGYTCDRNTFHVYLDNNSAIHRVIYDHKNILLDYKFWEEDIHELDFKYLVPDKRLYPACCDYEFCQVLLNMDIDLPFTTFEEREFSIFHGLLLEELKGE